MYKLIPIFIAALTSACSLSEKAPPYVPVKCSTNEYVSTSKCIPCSPGYVRTIEDPVDGPDTACEAVLCDANQRVLSNECVSCEPGSLNDAGNDASQGDTVCEPISCLENEHVVNHMCVPCNEGYLRSSGDLADGDDTYCEPVRCGVDERVQDRSCVECSQFQFNDPGDSIAEGDTFCEDKCRESFGLYCEDFIHSFIKDEKPLVNSEFGLVISSNSHTIAVGDSLYDSSVDGSAAGTGRVVLYSNIDDEWVFKGELFSGDLESRTSFGSSIGVSRDRMVVGAPSEGSGTFGVRAADKSDKSSSGSGAVYCYDRIGTSWTPRQFIKAEENKQGAGFGRVVGVTDTDMAISSKDDFGQVHMYKFIDRRWVFVQTLQSMSVNREKLDFGSLLSIEDSRMIIRSRAIDDETKGEVSVYEREDSIWVLKGTIMDEDAGDVSSISLSGNTIAVGYPKESSDSMGVNENINNKSSFSGAVYVYVYEGSNWVKQAFVKSNNTGDDDRFGERVVVKGDELFVSAPREDSSYYLPIELNDNDYLYNSGAVYALRRKDGVWKHVLYVKPPHLGEVDYFGDSLSVSDDYLVVGAPLNSGGIGGVNTPGSREDRSLQYSGAVHVFKIKP